MKKSIKYSAVLLISVFSSFITGCMKEDLDNMRKERRIRKSLWISKLSALCRLTKWKRQVIGRLSNSLNLPK